MTFAAFAAERRRLTGGVWRVGALLLLEPAGSQHNVFESSMPSSERRNARCVYVVLLGGCAVFGLLAGLVSTEIKSANEAETLLSNAPRLNAMGNRQQRRSAQQNENRRRSKKFIDGRGIGRPSGLGPLHSRSRQQRGHAADSSALLHVQTISAFPKGNPFRVHEFFADGPGKKYNTKNRLDRLGLNNPSLNSMTFIQWNSKGGVTPTLDLPHSVLYFHMRKAAGTTIEKAMVEAARIMAITTTGRIQAKTAKLFPWKYRRNEEYKKLFRTKSMEALKIVKESNASDAKVFTVIRDPVSRFLSGVSQQLDSVNKTKTNECVQATPRSTIDCVLDKIQEFGLQFNVHYIPQAVNLKGVLRGQKIPVEIFEMKDLPQILTQFGADTSTRENPGDAKDGMLAKINSSILDDELINTICELFKIDVDMMHYLGLKVPYCDPDSI